MNLNSTKTYDNNKLYHTSFILYGKFLVIILAILFFELIDKKVLKILVILTLSLSSILSVCDISKDKISRFPSLSPI